jgi:hypothetical protein
MSTWINDIIQHNKKKIFEYPTIQEYCFLYLYDKELLKNKNIDDLQGEEEILSAKGYKQIYPDIEELNIITRSINTKIAHYSHDKYKLIGICLVSEVNSKAYEYLEYFVNNASTIEVFLIQKFFQKYEDVFKMKLLSDAGNTPTLNILKYIYQESDLPTIDDDITKLSQKDLETIDLIVLLELQNFYSKKAISKTTYLNLNSKDIIVGILNNFENAIKKITDQSMRYGKEKQDRLLIKINDEYDVQDLLYVILKSIFPQIKYEDDISNYGGSSKRLDFYLQEDGIILEVKEINKADDKKYTKQMKEDLQSYHVVNNLSYIIFFIYAPNAIQDVNSFLEMEGQQTIQNKTFNVIVIVIQ